MARPMSMTIAELEKVLLERKGRVDKLERQRANLEKKLVALDREIARLGGEAGSRRRGGGAGGIRPRNEKSLPDAIEEVLRAAGKPMRVPEITEGVQAVGYRSSSPNFKSIVNQTLIKERKRFAAAERGVYQLKKS